MIIYLVMIFVCSWFLIPVLPCFASLLIAWPLPVYTNFSFSSSKCCFVSCLLLRQCKWKMSDCHLPCEKFSIKLSDIKNLIPVKMHSRFRFCTQAPNWISLTQCVNTALRHCTSCWLLSQWNWALGLQCGFMCYRIYVIESAALITLLPSWDNTITLPWPLHALPITPTANILLVLKVWDHYWVLIFISFTVNDTCQTNPITVHKDHSQTMCSYWLKVEKYILWNTIAYRLCLGEAKLRMLLNEFYFGGYILMVLSEVCAVFTQAESKLKRMKVKANLQTKADLACER